MDKIVKFLECYVPSTICNLECEYCYVIQENKREMKKYVWNYDVVTVAKALRKERFGGMMYISLCAAGETLTSDEIIDLVQLLLEDGHAVNITTNGKGHISKIVEGLIAFIKHLGGNFSD